MTVPLKVIVSAHISDSEVVKVTVSTQYPIGGTIRTREAGKLDLDLHEWNLLKQHLNLSEAFELIEKTPVLF